MAEQINIHGSNEETNIFEQSSQIINIVETADNSVSIIEPQNESISINDSNLKVNIFENEDRVIVVYEPGQRGPKGDSGSGSGGTGTVPDGTVSSSQQILNALPSNLLSSSTQIATDITGAFFNVSSSLAQRVQVFENKTLFSASQQVQFSQISNIPSGILSSSQGFVLSTETSSFLRNDFSSSAETRFNRLEQQTSSYAQISILTPLFSFTASTLTRLGIIEQATSSYVLNVSTQSFALKTEISGAFTQDSGSFQSRIFTLENKTLISGSDQLSGSYDLRYQRLGTGLISSSGQISNEISGSFVSASNSLSSRIQNFENKTLFSGSNQVQYNQITGIPSNLISGSDQLSSSYDQRYERKGSGLLSSSQQITQLIPNLVSSSAQINTGSYSGSFNGNGSNLTGIVSSSYALSSSYSPYIQTIGIRITTQDIYITEGSKGYRHIGFDSNIIKIRGIANATGSINLNIKRNNILLGNYQLSNQTGSIDSTLSGWTTNLNNNDMIEFYVSQSSTTITDLTFFMDLQNR